MIDASIFQKHDYQTNSQYSTRAKLYLDNHEQTEVLTGDNFSVHNH